MPDSIQKFTLERSTDGSIWGFLDQNISPSTRTYLDPQQPNPTFYYRLTGYTVAGVLIPYNIVPVSNQVFGAVNWLRHMTCGVQLNPNQVFTDSLNVLVVGQIVTTPSKVVDFGQANPPPGSGNRDGFIMKYSPANAPIAGFPKILTVGMASTFGNDLSITAGVLDSAGNIIVGGFFQGTFNPGNGNVTAQGVKDAFVAKYNPAGDHLIWFKHFLSFGQAVVGDLAVDGNDNIFCDVQFGSDFDFGDGIIWHPHVDSLDFGLAKLRANDGFTLWSKAWATAGQNTPRGIVVAPPTGDPIIVGQMGGAIDLGSGTAVGGAGMVSVARYRGDTGAYMTARTLSVNGVAVAIDPNTATLWVAGGFTGTVDFGDGVPTTTPFGGNGGTYIVSYNAGTLTLLTKRVFGQNGSGAAAIASRNGSIIVSGNLQGYVDLTGGTNYIDYPNSYYAVKYGSGFAHIWSHITSAAGTTSAALDNLGRALVAGGFSFSFDAGDGKPISATGSEDGFLVQYAQ